MGFDLKKDPWYIRVNSPEESAAVQEWLFDKGMCWENIGKKVSYAQSSAYITNSDSSGRGEGYLLYGVYSSYVGGIGDKRKEIKVNFKSTLSVDGVEYPDLREKVEIGGKMYYKEDVEKALHLLQPIG